jgi:hypothetical protein
MGIVWLVKGKVQGLDGISFFTLLLIVCPQVGIPNRSSCGSEVIH